MARYRSPRLTSQAKHKVRKRLHAYDDVGPHPHMGDTLLIPQFKWRQYMLPDDQQLIEPKSCPFQVPAPASFSDRTPPAEFARLTPDQG